MNNSYSICLVVNELSIGGELYYLSFDLKTFEILPSTPKSIFYLKFVSKGKIQRH